MQVVAYLSEIASIFAPEWTPDPSLLEPEDSNLIDFPDTPLQYEPGYGAAAQSRPGDVTVTFRQETLGLVLRGVDATGGEVTSVPLPRFPVIGLALGEFSGGTCTLRLRFPRRNVSVCQAPTPETPCAYVMLTDVKPDSEAAGSPQVMKGMVLKAVQGRPVQGLSFSRTLDTLRSAGRPVSILMGALSRPP